MAADGWHASKGGEDVRSLYRIKVDLFQAEIYEHEGNDQQTYLLLFRHAQLVIGCLSKHPDIRIAENRAAFVLAEQAVQSSLSKLEILKPRINKRHERYVQLIRERNNRRALSHGSKPKPSLGILENALDPEQRVPDPAVAGAAETLAADDHKELAVKLAHQELKRRALARKATRQAGIPEEVEQERRSAGLWGNWEEAYIQDDKAIDQDTLSRQMQNVRVQVEATKRGRPRDNRQQPNPEGSLSTYHYPAIPGRNAHESWLANSDSPSPSSPSPPPTSSHDVPQYSKPPELPPKLEMTTTSHNGPSNPRKSPSPLENLAQLQASKSPLPKSLTPATFVFKPSAYLENGSPLRTIFLPPDLRKSFLAYAEANTRANLETCGILCGTLISNALFISKLVIPDQESTSDTCETINEGELFDYVDGEDLMVLGWIHTHPTQTCFLSSRDVHTHCGYQVMMPESIAIVCAPSKGE